MPQVITDQSLAELWDVIASRRLAKGDHCAAVRAWRAADRFAVDVPALTEELDAASHERDELWNELHATQEALNGTEYERDELRERLGEIHRLAS